MKRWLLPVIPLAVLLVFLEFAVRIGWIKAFLVPPPSAIAQAYVSNGADILAATFSTGLCALAGLVLSFVLGSLIAIALSTSRLLRAALYPYATFFQTVPIIAIAPILVIWFGFGRPTVITAAFVVSIFPVIASTLLGLESTDPELVELFRFYQASPRDRLLKLRLPFALPQIFSGLRIASGLAVIGAIAGEFVGGGGLGSIVDAARTTQRIDIVFAAVLASAFIGLVFICAVNALSWLCLRHWHASATNKHA